MVDKFNECEPPEDYSPLSLAYGLSEAGTRPTNQKFPEVPWEALKSIREEPLGEASNSNCAT